jgi:DNA-binding FadR family transcriptional regulator
MVARRPREVNRSFAPLGRDSLGRQVARALAQHIIQAGLPPGARLPSEGELALQFGVGRSTVREGLRSLEQAGLIDVRPGARGGVFVAPADLAPSAHAFSLLLHREGVTMAELVDARLALETELARAAALRAEPADLEALREALDETPAHPDSPDACAAVASAFHLAMARASKNRVLLMMLSSILYLIHRSAAAVSTSEAARAAVYSAHEQIYQAIARRDPTAAEAALRAHLAAFRQRFLSLYGNDQVPLAL